MIERDHVGGDLLRVALAGLAATWAMGRVTAFLYEREGERAHRRKDAARDGKTAYGIAAATSRAHIRPTHRNLLPPEATWQFTGLRLARDV
jgi:formylglycine-generating enzyme required for sulfatase activity